MSDMYSTTHPADEGDADIPVLTDIIDEDSVETTPEIPLVTVSDTAAAAAAAAAAAEAETEAQAATELINQRLRSLEHIETELSARLSAELALQIPVLL